MGILILGASYPCVPGNEGDATTFDIPFCYERVVGESIYRHIR